MSLGGDATEADGELVSKLFGSVGKIWRADEKLFDAITGLRYHAFNVESLSISKCPPFLILLFEDKYLFRKVE